MSEERLLESMRQVELAHEALIEVRERPRLSTDIARIMGVPHEKILNAIRVTLGRADIDYSSYATTYSDEEQREHVAYSLPRHEHTLVVFSMVGFDPDDMDIIDVVGDYMSLDEANEQPFVEAFDKARALFDAACDKEHADAEKALADAEKEFADVEKTNAVLKKADAMSRKNNARLAQELKLLKEKNKRYLN